MKNRENLFEDSNASDKSCYTQKDLYNSKQVSLIDATVINQLSAMPAPDITAGNSEEEKQKKRSIAANSHCWNVWFIKCLLFHIYT